MRGYRLAHLTDEALLRDLATLVGRDRTTTVALLAHIAEVDARRLFVPAGYPSMHAYCVEELRLSEDAAYKRIQAARAARRFPILFDALAEGRLHLAAVCLLAAHLTPENAGELIEASTHRRKSEVEELLARRFGSPEIPAKVCAIPARCVTQLARGQVVNSGTMLEPEAASIQSAPDPPRMKVGPPERYLLQVTLSRTTREKLRYARALLSHAVPDGNVPQVLDRALDTLIRDLERRKFGAVSRRSVRPCATTATPRKAEREGEAPKPRPRATSRERYVPANVRRAAWERDEGRCTFVSARGTRCNARRFLEFDHIEPVARGGAATVEGMRLRCRAHNQYEAERAFGAAFMQQKRARPKLAAAEARKSVQTDELAKDVIAGLRALGCRAAEARRAAEFSSTHQGAGLEECLRAALAFLGGRSTRDQVHGHHRACADGHT
jgi:hypothetical protein